MGFFDGGFGSVVGGVGSIVGGIVGANNASNINAQNYAAQKEFAQNGIRWRVEDAKAAGLHPLAALGASPSSYSPSSVVGGDYGISDAAQTLGQGIDRAQQAKMLKEERLQAQQEQRERNALDKELLRSQIRNIDAQTEATVIGAAYDLSRHIVATQQSVPGLPSQNNEFPYTFDITIGPDGLPIVLGGDRLTENIETTPFDAGGIVLTGTNALLTKRLRSGEVVNGYVLDLNGRLVRASSPSGRRAIAHYNKVASSQVGSEVRGPIRRNLYGKIINDGAYYRSW